MSQLGLWKKRLEEKLRQLVPPFEPQLLYEATTYYLFQEGKRLRPLIVCAVSQALGGDLEDALVVGCAVEMVHNYSLIHDDLPALDNDSIRRGKPTCHIVFGEDIALLAGDALLTLAFEVLSDKENFRSMNEKEILLLIRELAHRSGYSGMVGGQVLDVRKLSTQEEISLKKTAQLFAFCFVAGGIVSKRIEILRDLEEIGLSYGLLFQVCDDYRDKDGFYEIYGEGLREKIKETYERTYERVKKLGLLTEEIKSLFDHVRLETSQPH